MASTADRLTNVGQHETGILDTNMPMAASSETFLNCFVNVDANGRVLNGTDAAAQRCAGVSAERRSNGAVAGATRANVRTGVVVEFFISGVTIDGSDVGRNCVIFDNDTVTDALTAVNDVVVGVVRRVEGGRAFVEVGRIALVTG